ncbi:hypothetical protein [Kitasatospora sp. NPDC001175]|uniref:hypothetical protein n=1 Tax=Kitasatospora sp. NPDC001175 TaxID=3157103 RepID=UPI003D07431C
MLDLVDQVVLLRVAAVVQPGDRGAAGLVELLLGHGFLLVAGRLVRLVVVDCGADIDRPPPAAVVQVPAGIHRVIVQRRRVEVEVSSHRSSR